MTRPARIRQAKGRTFAFSPHGGRNERRRLTASAALVGDSDWPGLWQVLRLERRVLGTRTEALRHQAVAAVTSCPPQRASPAQVPPLWRQHRSVEHRWTTR